VKGWDEKDQQRVGEPAVGSPPFKSISIGSKVQTQDNYLCYSSKE